MQSKPLMVVYVSLLISYHTNMENLLRALAMKHFPVFIVENSTLQRKRDYRKIIRSFFSPIFMARNLWKKIFKKKLQHKENDRLSQETRKKDQDSPVQKILLNYFPTVHTNYKIFLMFLALFHNTLVYS